MNDGNGSALGERREFRAADLRDTNARERAWDISVAVGYAPICLAPILDAIGSHAQTPLLVVRDEGNAGGQRLAADLIYFYAFTHEPGGGREERNGGTLFVKGYSCGLGKFIKRPLFRIVAVHSFTALPADAVLPTDEIAIENVPATLAFLQLAGVPIE
jgi:hypothetical protein